ncbi:HAD-IA family hydrolase [Kiloniella sp. b19]|uniref:HAD-IA family hydrolase n=1 Tax=Kiloniella sp. GXU_MW_B19 TaxID=3141326 RepID=UPI0031DE8069
MNQAFKLVVFDFDGTIVDSQAMIHQGMSEAFRVNDLDAPSLSAVKSIVGLSLEYAIAELMPDGGKDWERTCKVADSYRHAFVKYRQDPDNFHEPLYPGVEETLKGLLEQNYNLAIATGKNMRGLENSLIHHGLMDYFETLKTADHGRSKPHPDILQQALVENTVEPHEAIMIGDTSFDMAMGRAAGTSCLGVRWGYHEDEELIKAGAHKLIDNFTDIPAALNELAAGIAAE